jgi:hypothetical protein
MASLTELANIMQTSPAQAFRQEDIAAQDYQLQQQALQEQAKEAKGAGGLPQMAQSVLPPAFKLTDDQGLPTVAGDINNLIVQSTQEKQLGQKLLTQAQTLPRGSKEQVNAISEARRLMNNSVNFQKQAKDLGKKAETDALYALGTATNSQEWDNIIKGWDKTGIPVPKNFPTEYSPENIKKVISMAPAEIQQKINNDNRKREEELRRERDDKRKEERFVVAMRELGGAISGKEYKDVKGQVEGLKNYIPESQIQKLGPKEIPAVSAKLEAAALTDELATLVQQNPAAAGLVGSFYKSFDKFLPERYDKEGAEAATQIISAEADKLEKSGAPKDEVTAARLIAKKAVDVINARALAASGGGRVLVSELRLQKDVLGLEGLSPTSAVGVYRGLAESDRKATKRYGIDPSTIKRDAIPEVTKPAGPAQPYSDPEKEKRYQEWKKSQEKK